MWDASIHRIDTLRFWTVVPIPSMYELSFFIFPPLEVLIAISQILVVTNSLCMLHLVFWTFVCYYRTNDWNNQLYLIKNPNFRWFCNIRSTIYVVWNANKFSRAQSLFVLEKKQITSTIIVGNWYFDTPNLLFPHLRDRDQDRDTYLAYVRL